MDSGQGLFGSVGAARDLLKSQLVVAVHLGCTMGCLLKKVY